MVLPKPSGGGAHNHESLVRLSTLMTPRTKPYISREKFCAIVASGYEPFRQMTAGMLNSIGKVDAYGRVFGKVDPRSKYEILKDYTFSVCFENSLFPGYYTEKPLHAWVAGTIPLYFSDNWVTNDFNSLSFINRHSHASAEDFIGAVRYFCDNKFVQEEMWRQPLILNEPSLAPVIEFLRKAYDAIRAGV